MKKFFIKTHGCKANQLESSIIREKLLNADYVEATDSADTDIFILNSCSVTETADIEALRTLRNIKHKNPDVLTIFTGCSAQLNYQKTNQNKYIDITLGNNDKFNIVDAINTQKSKVDDVFSIKEFNNQFIHNYSKTRGYLKIQDGCNNYCSYCTIPFARGESRSNSVDNIIEQIKIYTNSGIKELVLTGIHIGQWGEDFVPARNLINLLEEIEKTEIARYRLGSLNPLEIDQNLLEFLANSQKFCPHFHLSLQSLNDKTLFAMNRKYKAEYCLELIEKIDSIFNLPFIGSDIIVGFPDENEKDFCTTFENAKKSKLSAIHVFPYSIRKNTKAAAMKNQVSEQTKKHRAELFHALAKEKINAFVNKNIGTQNQILIEKKPDRKTGFLKGVTPNYLTILTNSKDISLCNTLQNVKITDTSANGTIINGVIY